EVTAASRQSESVFDAPASVTLVPQEELRAFGFQTVWDALGGLRGIYQTNDHSYASLGFRGFSQPQDYGNRILMLTDGHVMNDDLLGSSYVGYDARSDLIDVERIEVVRGPGSALYGTNAFFGVINVVTRDRDTLLRPHAAVATDGFRMGRLRLGGGTRFSRDVGCGRARAASSRKATTSTFRSSRPRPTATCAAPTATTPRPAWCAAGPATSRSRASTTGAVSRSRPERSTRSS